MATYTGINDTRGQSVAITPTDIGDAVDSLWVDAASVISTLVYDSPTSYEEGAGYVYLGYGDGTEAYAEGSVSSSGSLYTATGSLYVSNYWSGFQLDATGTVKLNVDTGSFSALLSEFELGNDFYNFTYKGSVRVAMDGSIEGSVSSMQFTRTTAEPAIWEAIIFTGSANFDTYGNLTGTITSVEAGYYDVVWNYGAEDATLTWTSLGKATGLNVSASSLESIESFDSLFALNLTGNDTLTGTAGDDYIDAGTGNDRVDGLTGDDEVYGGAGNDKLTDMLGDNFLDGGEGNNTITAGSGDDDIYAGAGNDKFNAGEGDNDIYAGAGNDKVTAGAGDDWIMGGAGADKISGGAGFDVFVFDNVAVGGFDTIADFSAADDMLMFDASVFTALVGGVGAGNLRFGTAAQDADDYLIFNTSGGKLYYDADGSGIGSAVQIAVLKGALSGGLSADNFGLLTA